MKKSITKLQIMKALKNEPILRRGRWFHSTDSYKGEKGCLVCAVGCVLRAMSFEKWAIKRGIQLNTVGSVAVSGCQPVVVQDYSWIKPHLKNKNYLAALSCFFESGKTRKQCIAFVKKNFPTKLTITVTI